MDLAYQPGLTQRIGDYADDGQAFSVVVGTMRFIVGWAAGQYTGVLVDPKRTGVYVLNNQRRCVVLDRHYPAATGSAAELRRIRGMTEEEFIEFLDRHPRTRKGSY